MEKKVENNIPTVEDCDIQTPEGQGNWVPYSWDIAEEYFKSCQPKLYGLGSDCVHVQNLINSVTSVTTELCHVLNVLNDLEKNTENFKTKVLMDLAFKLLSLKGLTKIVLTDCDITLENLLNNTLHNIKTLENK